MAQLHTDELRQNHIIITYDYLRVFIYEVSHSDPVFCNFGRFIRLLIGGELDHFQKA